jgi:biofilm PGA synthesis N-glycosyltransferase PgaC
MSSTGAKYVVITPVRDEEAHVTSTIRSMIHQTLRPAEWIIVNDGSTDGTARMLDDYAGQFPWIRAVHRDNRGFRKSGGGVVEAFNDGFRSLKCNDWDFIVKLDGDLEFQPDYFQSCLELFAREARLGVGGGVICYLKNGFKLFEEGPAFHVRGATKIYRRACWEAIGGFWPAPGWDTIDEVKANMFGWTTKSFPELHLVHHRPTGSADGLWAGHAKNGRANYISGYHPLFMFSKCLLRLPRKPYVIGAIALGYGYVTGYVKHIPRINEPATIAYVRRQQLRRLFLRETIWR